MAAYSSSGVGADLCSLVIATGHKGMAWSWVRGGSSWSLGQGSSPEGALALAQAPQGRDHSSKLPEFKECLDKTLQMYHLNFGWCCVELDLVILVSPFQVRNIFALFQSS